VHFILSQQTGFGSFSFTLNSEVEEEMEPNHWCHGAPGAIPLFLEAYLTFKNQDFLEAALKSGKCVWKKGLIRKGFGLCHGISGNAYLLHSIYRVTGDILWKQRAQMFLLWTGDQDI
jgi:lantibiotic modifying enzyme